MGLRVRRHRGTLFRQWATEILGEYLAKGFTMDDERLKNRPGPDHRDYFHELLERIREIRASERCFYQKVLDIYATSVNYKSDMDLLQPEDTAEAALRREPYQIRFAASPAVSPMARSKRPAS